MKIFSHVNENGLSGYELLPTSLLLFDRIMLWTPNPKKIDELYFAHAKDGASNPFLRSNDVLELIKEGYIQVLGREDWLTKEESRNGNLHKDNNWYEFDSRIRDICYEDLKKLNDNDRAAERRVRFVPEEEGHKWAEKIWKSNDDADRARVDFVSTLLKKNHLPEGIKEKTLRYRKREDKIKIALRDIKNHVDAFKYCGADKTIDGKNWAMAVFNTMNENINDLQFKEYKHKSFTEKDAVKMLNLIETMRCLKAPRNPEQLKEFIASKSAKKMRQEIDEIMHEDIRASDLLSSQLNSAKGRIPKFFKTNAQFDLIDKGITVSGLIAAFFSEFNDKTLYGILTTIYAPAKEIVRRTLPVKYEGYHSPFLIAGKRISVFSIDELHSRINDLQKALENINKYGG